MHSDQDRQAFLPDRVLSLSVSERAWNGVRFEVGKFQCAGEVIHRLRNENHTRLSVVLEEVASPCEPRFQKDRPCPIDYMPRHMLFAPAGTEVWGYSADARYVKDATLIFNLADLHESLGLKVDTAIATAPRLRFWDDRIWPLVKLLSEVVDDNDPSTQLYGDGLMTAILSRLLSDSAQSSRNQISGLAPKHLRLVTEFIDERLPEHVTLAELAAVVNLSQSHFSRAFKASTGLAPYRYQLDARIRRAQALLIDTDDSLAEIAEATGFADSVHFGRIFRKFAGATPAVWRQDRKI